MTHTTQCPDCQTRFKVNDAQLAAAGGLVRCGRCSHVFNATHHLVTAEPPRLVDEANEEAGRSAEPTPPPHTLASELDDFELEVPDFDPEAARAEAEAERLAAEHPPAGEAYPAEDDAPQPYAEPAASPEDIDAFQQALTDALRAPVTSHRSPMEAPLGDPFDDAPTETPPHHADTIDETVDDGETPAIFDTRRTAARPIDEELPINDALTAREDDEQHEPSFATHLDGSSEPAPEKRAWWFTALLIVVSLAGVLVLAGQLVYLNRTRISAEVPELRPALEAACKAFGCKVALPTDLEYIRTEWSDCPQLPDHPNLLQLQAKVRNRAAYPQAWPMMELTLKDADDQVLVRKVFTPKEYLKHDDFMLGRFNANSEARIDILFDAGPVRPRGYSIYWFYP